MVGRRLDSRSGERPAARPGPPPRPVRRPADPALQPSRRGPRPAGPLVADSSPSPRVRLPEPDPEPGGRLRRFARRYGWRAYAVPALAVATVVTLADLALTTPAETRSAGTSAAATSSVGPPAAPPIETPAAVPTGPTGSPDFDVDAAPTSTPPTVPGQYVEAGAGSVTVVDGTSRVLGRGPLRRFAVEVEDGIRVDARAFAAAVEQTLGDPRSWGADGRMSFQRVGRAAVRAGQYDFKVSLISPGSMETYCPGVGTGGYTSCRYGERAVINLARWATAVPHYGGDVATYRQYVVNHEVGHALGNGHVDCPGAGQPAPVMFQQTLGLAGCTKNAWPFP